MKKQDYSEDQSLSEIELLNTINETMTQYAGALSKLAQNELNKEEHVKDTK